MPGFFVSIVGIFKLEKEKCKKPTSKKNQGRPCSGEHRDGYQTIIPNQRCGFLQSKTERKIWVGVLDAHPALTSSPLFFIIEDTLSFMNECINREITFF